MKTAKLVTFLRLLYVLQNVGFAVVFYLFTYSIGIVDGDTLLFLLAGSFWLTIVFIALMEGLLWKHSPNTILGLLVILVPSYIGPGINYLTAPDDVERFLLEVSFIYTAGMILAFSGVVISGVVHWIKKKEYSRIWGAVAQLIFIGPGLAALWIVLPQIILPFDLTLAGIIAPIVILGTVIVNTASQYRVIHQESFMGSA